MKSRPIILSFFIAGCSILTMNGARDENVVIASGMEEYRFIAGKYGPEVVHSVSDEYLATRRSETIHPHIFHNNIVRLDKASGGKLQYRNVNSPAVFHDDSKVCYFDSYLSMKGKKVKAQFKRTFTDAAHFTGFYPREEYPVKSKTIVVEIPAAYGGIELVDHNMPVSGITRSEEGTKDGGRRITYTISDLSELPSDASVPSGMSSVPYVMVRGYFPDTDSLYRYHRMRLDVDTALVDASRIVTELKGGAVARDSIIGRIYRYVQQNIRYVAFEVGEAAYRPDAPAEVMRKRYGDCKGMALLLCTLLNRAGIDAGVAIVGTRSIPFLISDNPSLAATNHMICIVPEGDGYRYLDPTHEQISQYHIPWSIRGKDAMMFLPDGYRMIDIPSDSPQQSVDVITYKYVLSPSENSLTGHAGRFCTEDFAEYFSSISSDIPKHLFADVMAKSLMPVATAYVMTDSLRYDNSISGVVSLTAPVMHKSALTEGDGITYLDLNCSDGPMGSRIDMEEREMDYEFALPGRIVRIMSVSVPGETEVVLPDNYEASCPQAKLSCEFSRAGDNILMKKTMEITSVRMPLADIPSWNAMLSAWNEACNCQVEIKWK